MQAGLICGGWDPYEGGQVYEIPLGTNRTYVTALKILWIYCGNIMIKYFYYNLLSQIFVTEQILFSID